MLRSSLGFHTLTLTNWLLEDFGDDKEKLMEDFRRYSHRTHSIQIYPDGHGNIKVRFYEKFKGIEWLIQPNIWDERCKMFFTLINVKINPKILSGIHDYITAATYDDMDAAITTFNSISKSISPILDTFEHYKLKRIDYCVNFSVNELAPECTSEQIMNLIQRGNVPRSYREHMVYDKTSHRCKPLPGSFYLVNKSVTINCYRKIVEVQARVERGHMKESPSVTQATLDTAQDIIRFEVQCKRHNVYTRSRRAKANGNKKLNLYEDLLSHEVCVDTINYYFNKIIGTGHWYSLKTAMSLIKSHHFRSQKENRLITALELVNRCRSLSEAKTSFQGDDLETFKRTLNDLNDLGINPVTIPRRWGVDRIWNLLDAYRSKVSEEHRLKQFEEELVQDKKLMKWAIAHS